MARWTERVSYTRQFKQWSVHVSRGHLHGKRGQAACHLQPGRQGGRPRVRYRHHPDRPSQRGDKGRTIQEQTHQCLANISAVLVAAGTSLEKVVSATVILVEEDDFAGMNEEWVRWFPSSRPARQAAKLPVRIPGLKVSIACIAEA